MLPSVAQAASPAASAAHPYAPILILILLVMGMATAILILTHVIGPSRKGAVKDDTYEAGMPTIGSARQRFNVQFYVVAMMFLLFDVEIVFLWPWALVFYDVAVKGQAMPAVTPMDAGFLLGAMGIFFVILIVGFAYDWGKGVFRWT
jgi:NADH-quinone oxidoreductase subunit A